MSRAFLGAASRGYVAVCGARALGTQASAVVAHGLSCPEAWDIPGTHVSCTGRRILNHWTTGKTFQGISNNVGFLFSNSPDTVIAHCPVPSFQWSGESCSQTLFQIRSWKTHRERFHLGTLPAKHQVLGSKKSGDKTQGITLPKEGKPIYFLPVNMIQRIRKRGK